MSKVCYTVDLDRPFVIDVTVDIGIARFAIVIVKRVHGEGWEVLYAAKWDLSEGSPSGGTKITRKVLENLHTHMKSIEKYLRNVDRVFIEEQFFKNDNMRRMEAYFLSYFIRGSEEWHKKNEIILVPSRLKTQWLGYPGSKGNKKGKRNKAKKIVEPDDLSEKEEEESTLDPCESMGKKEKKKKEKEEKEEKVRYWKGKPVVKKKKNKESTKKANNKAAYKKWCSERAVKELRKQDQDEYADWLENLKIVDGKYDVSDCICMVIVGNRYYKKANVL